MKEPEILKNLIRTIMKSNLFKYLFSLLLMAILSSYLLKISWNKWADLLVDFGREVYIPWQIAEGAALYRDLSYFSGPFSPYLNSIIFYFFGSNLITLVILNLILLLVIIGVIFRYFLEITDLFTATALALTFIGVFAFSQYTGIGNYNYVTPYSHEMTHGILLSVSAIYSFRVFIKKQNAWWLFPTGILTGLTFLTKPELFIALAGSLGLGEAVLVRKTGFAWRTLGAHWGSIACGFFLAVGLFLGYLSIQIGLNPALQGFLTPYRLLVLSELIHNPFYLWASGFDHPWENAGRMVRNLFEVLSIVLLIVGFSILVSKVKPRSFRMVLLLFFSASFILSIPLLLYGVPWVEKLRFLPVVAGFSAIYFAYRVFREQKEVPSDRHLSFLVFSTYSFLLLGKIILNTHAYHYGFGLAMPATLMAVSLLLFHLRCYLKNKYHEIIPFRLLSMALLGIFILAHINISHQIFSLKDQKITTAKGTLFTWNPRINPQGRIMGAAIQEILKIMGPQDRFMVFPEGVMLNYLTERKNSTPYINFMPPELIVFKEEKILEAIRKNPPSYILMAEKNTVEYGYHYFGKDYGQEIYGWLMKNYSPVSTLGAPPLTGSGFGIQILKYHH